MTGSTTCTPAGVTLLEGGFEMSLVASGNVFAAGLTPHGVVVRFCNKRDSGARYLYPGSRQEHLEELLRRRKKHEYVVDVLHIDYPPVDYDVGLRHPLRDEWGICGTCHAVVELPADSCPTCAGDLRIVTLERCKKCRTYRLALEFVTEAHIRCSSESDRPDKD